MYRRELFNGIVTLDKLHKFYKSGGLGAEETFNAIIQHVRQQVDKKIFSVDEAVKLYTELVLSALLRRDDQDRGRVSRKLTQLLKEAVLNSLSSASGNSFAVSPVKIAATPANTKTNVQAHGTVPGSSVVNKTANSSVKKTANSTTAAFTASKFVSLDDDEFIVEDSPPPRPPPMKDLSMFVETPAKPQEQSQNQGQGQSHGNTNARAAPPPPPAIIDEEEEFDFL